MGQESPRCYPRGAEATLGPPLFSHLAGQARGPLPLRAPGVPSRAIARVFGRDDVSWHRLEVALGRNGVAGATARRAARRRQGLRRHHRRRRLLPGGGSRGVHG